MARALTNFVCQQCGYVSPSFLGRCPSCDSWNSFVETVSESRDEKVGSRKKLGTAKPVKLSEIKAEQTRRMSTGINELDLVLGGGIVPGMAVLLAGEPGIGKSTLLLQLVDRLQSADYNKSKRAVDSSLKSVVLYVAGEESAAQIKVRADRLGLKLPDLIILEQTDADVVAGVIDQLKVSAVIIDSIQTMVTGDLSGTAGTVGQVRESAARIIKATKAVGIPLFIVGHVTKEGAIAGPKVLEHIVDTVLTVEGDRYEGLRLVRTSKNRFGPTDEVGIFEMKDDGLIPARAREFVSDSGKPNPGSCLTIAMEGTRPVLVEIQALVTSTPLPAPRRVSAGVDYNRLQTIVAVLQKRLNLPLYRQDIYVSVSGGLKLLEPAIDLPIALAIMSSYKNKALSVKTVAIGELDLLGNIRPVNSLEKRLKEARVRGYKSILSAESVKSLLEIKL